MTSEQADRPKFDRWFDTTRVDHVALEQTAELSASHVTLTGGDRSRE